MNFGNEPILIDLTETRIANNVIRFSYAGKLLGIHIDTNLKFKYQISCISSKVSKFM